MSVSEELTTEKTMHRLPNDPEFLDLDHLPPPIDLTTGTAATDADDLRLITIIEAANRLDLSRSKVYELIADGELPTVRIGRARRIDLADLRAFVDRHRAA